MRESVRRALRVHLSVTSVLFLGLGACSSPSESEPASARPDGWKLEARIASGETGLTRADLRHERNSALFSPSDRLEFPTLRGRNFAREPVQLEVESQCTGADSSRFHGARRFENVWFLRLRALLPNEAIANIDDPERDLSCDVRIVARNRVGSTHAFELKGLRVKAPTGEHGLVGPSALSVEEIQTRAFVPTEANPRRLALICDRIAGEIPIDAYASLTDALAELAKNANARSGRTDPRPSVVEERAIFFDQQCRAIVSGPNGVDASGYFRLRLSPPNVRFRVRANVLNTGLHSARGDTLFPVVILEVFNEDASPRWVYLPRGQTPNPLRYRPHRVGTPIFPHLPPIMEIQDGSVFERPLVWRPIGPSSPEATEIPTGWIIEMPARSNRAFGVFHTLRSMCALTSAMSVGFSENVRPRVLTGPQSGPARVAQSIEAQGDLPYGPEIAFPFFVGPARPYTFEDSFELTEQLSYVPRRQPAWSDCSLYNR